MDARSADVPIIFKGLYLSVLIKLMTAWLEEIFMQICYILIYYKISLTRSFLMPMNLNFAW